MTLDKNSSHDAQEIGQLLIAVKTLESAHLLTADFSAELRTQIYALCNGVSLPTAEIDFSSENEIISRDTIQKSGEQKVFLAKTAHVPEDKKHLLNLPIGVLNLIKAKQLRFFKDLNIYTIGDLIQLDAQVAFRESGIGYDTIHSIDVALANYFGTPVWPNCKYSPHSIKVAKIGY